MPSCLRAWEDLLLPRYILGTYVASSITAIEWLTIFNVFSFTSCEAWKCYYPHLQMGKWRTERQSDLNRKSMAEQENELRFPEFQASVLTTGPSFHLQFTRQLCPVLVDLDLAVVIIRDLWLLLLHIIGLDCVCFRKKGSIIPSLQDLLGGIPSPVLCRCSD